MPNHECETYDFPVQAGVFNYSFTKRIGKKWGGTWQIAVQEAIDQARGQAEAAGNAAMQNEKCTPPCQRLIYVDVSLARITPTWTPGKVGKELVIPISGIWQAGILCFRAPESEHKKADDKKPDDDKPKKKAEKKPGKKHR